jgi:hypothetical protein
MWTLERSLRSRRKSPWSSWYTGLVRQGRRVDKLSPHSMMWFRGGAVYLRDTTGRAPVIANAPGIAFWALELRLLGGVPRGEGSRLRRVGPP